MKIEHLLKQLDRKLSKVSKKDLNYLFILIFGAIGFLSYYFLFDIAEEYQKKIHLHSDNIAKKLNSDKQFLQRNSQKVLTALKNQITLLENQVDEIDTTNNYLEYKMSQIDYLFYDQETWGTFINKISQNAQKNHIQIINFTNTVADSNATFGHLLDLSILSRSNFKNTLKFINYLESNNLVVDIHDLSLISKSKRITSDMNLSIWGINK